MLFNAYIQCKIRLTVR